MFEFILAATHKQTSAKNFVRVVAKDRAEAYQSATDQYPQHHIGAVVSNPELPYHKQKMTKEPV